jgi:hypothetical protein
MKTILAWITIPERRGRFALYMVINLVFTASPISMLSATAASAPEPQVVVVQAFTVSSLSDIDALRSRLAHQAVDAIGLEHRFAHRYGGLSAVQANSVLVIAEAFGPEHFEDAVRISWCESRLDPKSMNGSNRNGTADRGLFQLNDGGTMQRLGVDLREVFDATTNAQAARVLFEDRGWQPWVCAKHIGLEH